MSKKIIIIGATGMVGGIALRLCLESPEVSKVTVIGRRSVGVEHEKLHEVIHEDFMDYTSVSESLKNQDVALFCLGVYTGTVPDDEFRKITVDYTLAFASALLKESPNASFCFLSGQGADQTEHSRMSFARYKGIAENALLLAGFPRVALFRPGYIYPVTPRKEPNLAYKITRALYPVVRHIYPNFGISSEDLALAMVRVGLDESLWKKTAALENRDIRKLVTQ
jgi:uncharacterized protein YbjT (DUF2867 family)